MKLVTWLAQRRKFVVAEVALVVTWAQVAWVPDGTVDRAEWVALVTALLGGLGVHAVGNAPVQSAVSLIREALRPTVTPMWHMPVVPVTPPPSEVGNP